MASILLFIDVQMGLPSNKSWANRDNGSHAYFGSAERGIAPVAFLLEPGYATGGTAPSRFPLNGRWRGGAGDTRLPSTVHLR